MNKCPYAMDLYFYEYPDDNEITKLEITIPNYKRHTSYQFEDNKIKDASGVVLLDLDINNIKLSANRPTFKKVQYYRSTFNWDTIIEDQLKPDTVLTINQIEPTGPSMFNFPEFDFGKNPKEFQYQKFIDERNE